MFSQTHEYALRAVIWLAGHTDEGPIGNQRIAEGTAVPASYLSKVLQGLARADILTSRRGVGGGFQLAKDADKLTGSTLLMQSSRFNGFIPARSG